MQEAGRYYLSNFGCWLCSMHHPVFRATTQEAGHNSLLSSGCWLCPMQNMLYLGLQLAIKLFLSFFWGQGYLKSLEDTTLVVVSHDRAFLDAVTTETIVFRHQSLAYHAGNYSGVGPASYN